MKLKINANSISKTNPNYEKVIYPVEDDRDLKVTILPLKSYEASNYIGPDQSINITKLLKDKVVKIDGLSIAFKDGVIKNYGSIEDVLNLPRLEELEEILNKITTEIIQSNSLTEDEEKTETRNPMFHV